MRYLWIGALVIIAVFSAACSGPTPKTPTFHFHFPKSTTTTTTTGVVKTPTTTASGPNDRLACAAFADLGNDVGKGHRRIANAFRALFRDLRNAENPNLVRDGHAAARALYASQVNAFKRAFLGIFTLCKELG